MSFERSFGGGPRDSAAEACLFAAAAANALALPIIVLGVLLLTEQRERELPLELTAVAEGTSPVRFSAREEIVHVGPTGEMRVGGKPVDEEWLKHRLMRLVSEAGDTAVTVRADARAPYGVVARILAAVRRAGVRDASLLTVEPPPR